MKKIFFIFALSLFVTGCASTVSTTNPFSKSYDQKKAGEINTFGLSTVDFEYASKKALDDFMMSPWLANPTGERWLVMMGDVINDTTFRIDTRRLTQRMMGYMTNTGKFAFTAAIGSMSDRSVKEYRELDNSALFDQNSGAKGKAIKPHLSMVGEIALTTNVSADRREQSLEYEFRLRVTDLSSGLIVFQSLTPISKTGSNKNFAW